MQGASIIFFAMFSAVLAGTYVGIRREWASPAVVAGGGVVLSMATMAMVSLANGNSPLHAIVVGVLMGGLFSGATIAIAWYYHSKELRARYASEQVEEVQS
jgi:hypothetical protein